MFKLSVALLALALFSCSSPQTGSTREVASVQHNLPDVKVVGADSKSFTVNINGPIMTDAKDLSHYDVVVVGAGLAGLSATVYLGEKQLNVLLLEKEPTVGGLASSGSTVTGAMYDRGAAYWTSTYEEEFQILNHIGLTDYKKYAITEPADSYLLNGKLYEEIWKPETVAKLPKSFEVFKYMLKKADQNGLIPNQPIEEAGNRVLDQMDSKSATQWIAEMPAALLKLTHDPAKNPGARALYRRFRAQIPETALKPMKDVMGLLDLYCKSALGTTCDQISAVAFANFYISEIETRYTSQTGTNKATQVMQASLEKLSNVVLKTSATVGSIAEKNNKVDVRYAYKGGVYQATADYVVYAGQLKFAPDIIQNFTERDPEHVKTIQELNYSHYSVHSVMVKGHPYRASYDTWTKQDEGANPQIAGTTDHDFTDVILGFWQAPEIKGYLGYRDFKKDPAGDSVLTIYHPLPPTFTNNAYSNTEAAEIARYSVNRMLELFQPVFAHGIEVTGITTNRWPFSVHIPAPGHFRTKARILRRPIGRVYFANNNMGTPAFEEALFRGHCAADNILIKLGVYENAAALKSKVNEPWTNCPIE